VLAPLYAPEKVPEADRLDVERLAADLRREDVPGAPDPDRRRHRSSTWRRARRRATPSSVMTSGDYGGLHDKLLHKLGDPVMPARLEHKIGSATCWTGSASRTRCWSSSGRTTW
jgi:hypothetical protein